MNVICIVSHSAMVVSKRGMTHRKILENTAVLTHYSFTKVCSYDINYITGLNERCGKSFRDNYYQPICVQDVLDAQKRYHCSSEGRPKKYLFASVHASYNVLKLGNRLAGV